MRLVFFLLLSWYPSHHYHTIYVNQMEINSSRSSKRNEKSKKKISIECLSNISFNRDRLWANVHCVNWKEDKVCCDICIGDWSNRAFVCLKVFFFSLSFSTLLCHPNHPLISRFRQWFFSLVLLFVTFNPKISSSNWLTTDNKPFYYPMKYLQSSCIIHSDTIRTNEMKTKWMAIMEE